MKDIWPSEGLKFFLSNDEEYKEAKKKRSRKVPNKSD
jgi:hypothetical protein